MIGLVRHHWLPALIGQAVLSLGNVDASPNISDYSELSFAYEKSACKIDRELEKKYP